MRPRPRVGAVVRFAPGRLVRLAYQATTSPLGAESTLGPVATSGIPLDKTFHGHLGDVRRFRGQWEWQWSPRTFTNGFIDHKRFGDITSARDPYVSKNVDLFAQFALGQLRNQLRDVSQLNVASPALLEDTIAVPAGSDAWVAGLAVNHVLSKQVSLASQYYWTRSAAKWPNGPKPFPFYPDHAFSVGATWVSPRHVYLSASAMYRSQRTGVNGIHQGYFRESVDGVHGPGSGQEVLVTFDADWTGVLAASWETASKRWSLETLVTDLFATAALHSDPFNQAALHGDPRRPTFSVTIKLRR